MPSIIEKLTDAVSLELSKDDNKQNLNEVDSLITEMKKTGLIKDPVYSLPLVDTLGKTYYSSLNKMG